MAKRFNLTTAQGTQGFQRESIYNVIDTIATLEIDNILDERMTVADRRTHDFYMAIQLPAFDMIQRGILVDLPAKEQLLVDLKKLMREIEGSLAKHEQVKPIWDHLEKNTGACAKPTRKDGKHKWEPGVPDTAERHCVDCGASRMKIRKFMPSSDDDLKHLFYDLFKMKPILNKDHKVTTDKEARERLREKYPKYAAVVSLVDQFADTAKQLSFLNFRSRDNRFRSNFSVGVTSTHRWSSQADNDGNGSNAQNITEKHRGIFVADPGMELCYADLKQAESNVIAHVAGDEQYIEAHRIGDTHTFVCRLIWPEGVGGKPWTWDIEEDKKLATAVRPVWDDKPGHDFRFQSKAIQHGSNLGLTAFGMSIQKRIPLINARDGQARYFKAFPGILGYQNEIRTKVQNAEEIITPLGVRFKLFGRPWDEHTYKEGLSVIPQSVVGHIISIGVWRIWQELPEAQLLAQVHDAILFQFPKGRYDIVYKALEMMNVPIPVKGLDGTDRTILIGTEAAVGHNWGHYNTKIEKGPINLEGIREIVFKSETEWSMK